MMKILVNDTELRRVGSITIGFTKVKINVYAELDDIDLKSISQIEESESFKLLESTIKKEAVLQVGIDTYEIRGYDLTIVMEAGCLVSLVYEAGIEGAMKW